MQSELNDLYQQVILDHNKNPRNFGILDGFTHHAEGHNPLCGDQIDVTLHIENNIITDIKFKGLGCAISKASASIMTTLVKGKKIDDAMEIFNTFLHIVTTDIDEQLNEEDLGKLAVFTGVREFPARVKCASLAWHTLDNALKNINESAITE